MISKTSLMSVFLGAYLASATHHKYYYEQQHQGFKPYHQAPVHPAYYVQAGHQHQQQQQQAPNQYLQETAVKGVYNYVWNLGGEKTVKRVELRGNEWLPVSEDEFRRRLEDQQRQFPQQSQQLEPAGKPQGKPEKKGWWFLQPKKAGGKKDLGGQPKSQQAYLGQYGLGPTKPEPTYHAPPSQPPPQIQLHYPAIPQKIQEKKAPVMAPVPQAPLQRQAIPGHIEEEKAPKMPVPQAPLQQQAIPQEVESQIMMPDIKPRLGEIQLKDIESKQLSLMDDKLYDLFGLPYNMEGVCYKTQISDEKIASNISGVWSRLIEHLRSRLPQLHSLLHDFLGRVGTKGYAYKRELQIKLMNLIVNQVVFCPQITQEEKSFITAALLLPIYAKGNKVDRHDFSTFFELAEKNLSNRKTKQQLNFGKYEQWFMYCKYNVVCLNEPHVFNDDYFARFAPFQRPFAQDVNPYEYFKLKTGLDLSLRVLAVQYPTTDQRVEKLITKFLLNAERAPRFLQDEL